MWFSSVNLFVFKIYSLGTLMYPYIEITDEDHPKLQVIRQKELKGKGFWALS